MKCLTVQQPWAWAIIHGGKDVENRTQLWSYRGPLAIHAGNQWSHRGEASDLIQQARQREHGSMPQWQFTTVAILGVVDLVDTHRAVGDCCQPWGEHGYTSGNRHIVHLRLENPRTLAEPIPCRGALGLWTPPADIIEQLRVVT